MHISIEIHIIYVLNLKVLCSPSENSLAMFHSPENRIIE